MNSRILPIIVPLLFSSGCLLLDGIEERDGAVPEASSISAQTCALKGFAYHVHSKVRSSCASCHGGSGPGVGSFAASDVLVAYAAARTRAALGNPRGSLLVARSGVAGHGNGCSVCGDAWGTVLSDSIEEWAKAEAGDVATCSSLPDLSGGSGGDGFDDGVYDPGSGVEVVVIPAGLAEFGEASGVHSILQANCVDCHAPGRQAAFAPFAQTDATEAYRAAKPRVNFVDVTLSKLLNRASNDAHCGICGDSALVASLTARLNHWRAEELVGAAETRPLLASKAINLPAQGSSRTLTWNLGTELAPPNPALAGATFQVTIERPAGTSFAFVYRVRNPTLVAGGGAIELRDIRFVLNGTEQPLIATFSGVEATVAAGQNSGALIATPALVSIVNAASDQLGFSFLVLRQP